MNVVFCSGQREYEAEIYYKHKHLHKMNSPNTSPQQEQENITENRECPEVLTMMSIADLANKNTNYPVKFEFHVNNQSFLG